MPTAASPAKAADKPWDEGHTAATITASTNCHKESLDCGKYFTIKLIVACEWQIKWSSISSHEKHTK